MRAAVLTGHGDLDVIQVIDDLPIPEPGRGEVRLRMKAAALNRLDLWVRQGWKGLKLTMPHVICADGAGVVDAFGEDVTEFQVGDAVSIDPTIIPSNALMNGFENQARGVHILGEQVPGVAAEYVVLPKRNLHKMPPGFSFEGAAAAGLVYVTAWHSIITRGGLRPGESVLIVGAGGGVNTATIQIAKLAGAKVYVVGSTAEKCRRAEELGADVTINREQEPNWSKVMYQLTNKQGVDIVVDNVGQATLADSIRSTRIGGRILIVGNTSGPMVELDIRQIFARQVSIIGSTMGPHHDYMRVMDLVFSGKLQPVISEVFPLEKAREAQKKLEEFDTFGKVVLKID
ncbi:MAG: alcohol dehydrogenase [Chloroflexi bacterium]|nr:MAG: alcohol dehydrogenase [Chloroflexota bacterium]